MRAKLVVGTAVGVFLAACGTGGSSTGGIEATSSSYVASDGIVVVSGTGSCVQTSGWSEKDTIGACEGGEAVAEAVTTQPASVAVAAPSAPAPVAEKVVLVGRTMFQFDSDLLSTEAVSYTHLTLPTKA